LGTSLVARVDGEIAGFLFGFYKQGGPPLPGDWHERWQGNMRIESQVMGVLPEYRGLRIGYLLKRLQAEQARSQGIGIIHWTVDPLQYPNAALNFGLLRAVAFTFTPDYYPFRNELNRAPASRFSLTWLIGSARVQVKPLHDARSTILHLDQHPEIVHVNEGWRQLDFAATAPIMAIEIPANWTQLQQQDPDEALAWRTATDRLFTHYIGSSAGNYIVTDVGVAAERRYLIIQQVSEYLWQRLEES
jgi:predicted GNAT superfamily acetyltransferase